MSFPPVNPAVARALSVQGYLEPTPVQSAVLEDGAQSRDLLVSAQTGSGKTVAYGLAMAGTILGELDQLAPGAAPLALIVAPTRELAIQVCRELTWLYAEAGAQVTSCVGGMDVRREHRALAAAPHIVVGTPGRLRDHLERGHLDLSALRVVVLDEADEMLDLGFREDLEVILDATPSERRTLLFSATIAREIAALARRYQREAIRIDTSSRNEPHGDIDYRAIRVAPHEIEHAVVNVLRHFEAPGALVFCATRESVRHLHASLRERGFNVVALSGELTQKERAEALQSLRDGRAQVCVATDVAARGLDLPDLGLVVHAELPANRAALLHRSGRTGRAGRKGTSVLLVPYSRRRQAEAMLGQANIKANWTSPPSADEIRARDQQRLLTDPIFTEPPSDEETALARAMAERMTAEQVSLALLRLHRSRLPAPEELFEADRSEPRSDQRVLQDRPKRGRRDGGGGDAAWFRLKVGRADDADPKWLIPIICRVGQVTKKDIGQIRIFERETKFEITRDVAERFAAAIGASNDPRNRIEPAGAPGPRDAASARPRRPPPPRGPARATGRTRGDRAKRS
jgi:ATP-dependent RNA helicase DeaD